EQEGRGYWQYEVEVGKQADGIQEHHGECSERQRDQQRPAAWSTHSDGDQAEQDPHPWPRESARELVEPEGELLVSRAVRESVEKVVEVSCDLLEARTIPWMLEFEVPLGGRRPDLPDALVRPRDPDDLARRDRLPPTPPRATLTPPSHPLQ